MIPLTQTDYIIHNILLNTSFNMFTDIQTDNFTGVLTDDQNDLVAIGDLLNAVPSSVSMPGVSFLRRFYETVCSFVALKKTQPLAWRYDISYITDNFTLCFTRNGQGRDSLYLVKDHLKGAALTPDTIYVNSLTNNGTLGFWIKCTTISPNYSYVFSANQQIIAPNSGTPSIQSVSSNLTKSKSCECGAIHVNGIHSSWCPLY